MGFVTSLGFVTVSPVRDVAIPCARAVSGTEMLELLGFELVFFLGPVGTGVMGNLSFFLMLCQWTSGAGIAAVGLGVGWGEFDGLVCSGGWGRGRVGFQLSPQVEGEFGD